MSDIDRLAKQLAKNIVTNENVTIQGENISFDGERLEPSDRSPRERIHRKERRYKKKKTIANPVFATIVVLVVVERDYEYELFLLTENYSALKEDQRWWDISYIKSMPKYFDGAPWYAWGFPGFTSKGVFSGAEYGFVDTIPTKQELGSPALLSTKTLDVNQQLGISSPLFWDDNNPAPVTKIDASFSVTDVWFSGFFRDNYVEITHLYEDRYGGLSFAMGRETFPDDWWIYPYFDHDVNITSEVFDIPVDIYRYVYSSDGSGVDFDSLQPEEYTKVIIPLYLPDGNGGVVLTDDGYPLIADSSAIAIDDLEEDPNWLRPSRETCEPIVGDCVADDRLVDSELRDFGVGSSWNVSCFSTGSVIVFDGEDTIETIAVSAMPVETQWSETPMGLVYKYQEIEEVLIDDAVSYTITNLGNSDPGEAEITVTGIVDVYKGAPSTPEGGTSTTEVIIATTPLSISLNSVREFRFKWSSESESREINADSYVEGLEFIDGADAGLTFTRAYKLHSNGRPEPRNIYNADPGEWVFYDPSSYVYNTIYPSLGGQLRAATIAAAALPRNPCNNEEPTLDIPPGTNGWYGNFSTIRILNWGHCYYLYNVGNHWATETGVPISRGVIRSADQRPYVVFSNGYKEYAPRSTDRLVVEGPIASYDYSLAINGVVYFYAHEPSWNIKYQTRIDWTTEQGGSGSYTDFDFEYANLLEKYRLKVFEDESEIFKDLYDRQYPTRLEGIQKISEYKLFVHRASIRFQRQFPGVQPEDWSWYKRGKGQISIDEVEGDCHQEGSFVYDKGTVEGKLGITTITEQDSDRDPEVLYKFIPYRDNGDEVLDNEVIPELSITYVHAGGKIYSGIHTNDVLQEITKPVTVSPNHQYSEIAGTPKLTIVESTTSRAIVAPLNYHWNLDEMPPLVEAKRMSVPIGETFMLIGTFTSSPINVGGSVWRRLDFSEGVLPLNYEGKIEPYQGVQWSNHHEYFVPRKRKYWGTNISGWADEGKWLNGWEPINTVGLTGYLPSGEFRSLSLYHETTTARLQYGIKGVVETVQGANGEPLHFVFAYGGLYSVFGKVNNGLDDDETIAIAKSPASNDLTQLLVNQNSQISINPPYPPEYDIDSIMRQEKYTWGGFDNYICPYTSGLAVETHGLTSQLPFLMYPVFKTEMSTSGVESTFEISVPFVDPDKSYSIAVNGVLSTQTAIDNLTDLRSAFLSDLTGLSNVTVSSTTSTITIRGQNLSIAVTGLDVTIDADNEPTPNVTATIYLPGINAPYTLEIDGSQVHLSLSNGMSLDAALDSLLNSLSAYDAEEVLYGDRIRIRGVYEVKQTEPKTHNDLSIVQSIVATESTDKPWRQTEIKWESSPTTGIQSSTNLEMLSTANVSKYLKYDDFDYSQYPYAKIEDTRIFSVHDANLLNEAQPNKLLDQDFVDDQAIVIKYSAIAEPVEWKEIELQVKQIQSSWFGADRDKVNIIAIAPSVVSTPNGSILSGLAIGIQSDYD